MRLRFTAFLILLWNCPFIKAQQNFTLHITSINSAPLLKSISYDTSFSSTKDRDKELQKVLLTCYDNAYLTATYDSIIADSLISKAYLNEGSHEIPFNAEQLNSGFYFCQIIQSNDVKMLKLVKE